MPELSQLVSIIIPSYNHSRYIIEAIESALAQTYRVIELVIVDDGSTDDTLKIINSYRGHQNITVITQSNRGAHQAINRGIEACRGQFVAILNSDDVYHKERIERCVDYIKATGADMVFTDLAVIDAGSQPCAGDKAALYTKWRNAGITLELHDMLLQGNVAFTTSNFFMTRDALRKVGPFRALRYCHDWDWLLRCSINGSCAWLREVLLYYRDHGSNTIDENNIWKEIVENAFMLATHMMRILKKTSPTMANMTEQVFRHMLNNNSFFPVPTMLFLWMLSGKGCSEEELLARLTESRYLEELMRITEHGTYDIRALLSPDYLENYFTSGSLKNITARIMRRIASLFGPTLKP
jgi:glycosyltransferase involved in cell wall biosynthesis